MAFKTSIEKGQGHRMSDPESISIPEWMAARRREFFPMTLREDIIATAVDLERYFTLSEELDPLIFRAERSHDYRIPQERHAQKLALYHLQGATHQECVLIEKAGEPIGYSVGRMTGATEFVMDRSAILPGHQKQGIYRDFLRAFMPYLAALGYERVVSFNAPNHAAAIIPKLKVGFVVGGMLLDENRGALVKMLYLCYEDGREALVRANNLPG